MKRVSPFYLCVFLFFLIITGCKQEVNNNDPGTEKIPVLFDTDANNELDDQHALAYLLLNEGTFHVEGVTVNATPSGGEVENHYKEAERILKLCKMKGEIPLFAGANGSFNEIKEHIDSSDFDGYQAVNFIIKTAKRYGPNNKLELVPVGKLTNIALALFKAPGIKNNINIVWLGSNYPEPGEYNQNADTGAMNYILQQHVPFEMVTVRYGQPTGTDAIRITQEEINQKMPGLGPEIEDPITGRHGGTFNNFGDYSVDLFKHIEYYGDPPSRALFDLAAVAILKNPSWADSTAIPAPVLIQNKWKEQPDNQREIILWENFKGDKIIADMFKTLGKAAGNQQAK